MLESSFILSEAIQRVTAAKPAGLPRPELGPKLKRFAAARRNQNLQLGNHDMVQVDIDWNGWPGKPLINQHTGRPANASAFTCKQCRVFHRGFQAKALVEHPCKGLKPPRKATKR